MRDDAGRVLADTWVRTASATSNFGSFSAELQLAVPSGAVITLEAYTDEVPGGFAGPNTPPVETVHLRLVLRVGRETGPRPAPPEGEELRPTIIARVGVLAAVYFVLTALPPFSSFSYGPVQVRVSEALMVLPALTPQAVPALFVGCLAANLASGLGPVDLVLGSLATLLAAFLVSRLRAPWLVPLPTIVINALVVGTYLPLLLDLPTPLWVSWSYIAAGEAVATVGLGMPLLFFLRSRPALLRMLRG